MAMVVIVGPSGCGKSTFSGYLKDIGWVFFVTHTTRNPRVGEIDGISYHFCDKKHFMSIDKIEYIEYPLNSGNYYGLSVKEVEEKSSSDNCVAVMNIDGALALKDRFPETKIIFIKAPIEILEERMRKRGDSEESIEKRLKNIVDDHEYENEMYADFVINNIDKDCAKMEFLKVIESII